MHKKSVQKNKVVKGYIFIAGESEDLAKNKSARENPELIVRNIPYITDQHNSLINAISYYS